VTDETHVDGNAVGGMLIDAFGREMTDARGCCRQCGTINALGAVHTYTRAPGDVLRCPVCETFLMVAVALPTGLRISCVGLRWMEAPAG
jgi:Family of unknown function (DUF6510)